MTALLAPAPPIFARRSTAAAAWGGRIYFFGGVGGGGTESILDVDNTLWRFDPAALRWQRLDAVGVWPSARRCCGFAAGAAGIYLWGGSGLETDARGEVIYSFLNDLWLLEPEAGRWRLLEASDDFHACPLSAATRPEPRYTPVWRVHAGRGLLFSGYTEDRLGKRKMNDLWLWGGAPGCWQRVPPQRAGYAPGAEWPGLRYGAMYTSGASGLYICGGFSDAGDHIDLWRWDWDAAYWECLASDRPEGEAPPPRYLGAWALYGNALWMFGGRSRQNPKQNYNDTWRFDLTARRWEAVTPQRTPHRYDADAPHIGYHAKSSSVVLGDAWYLWGGEGRHGHVSDLWRFDFTRAVWEMVQPARADDPLFW